ncbi:hypothetical protein NDI47_23100 [Microcoleus vaginatus GB1-A2]|uniref:hypothetical protein n=1 Tax=Microcoleus vaginatus TaxID=119532 RepID=UPI00168327E2|nr:hypothetical protein [Microcoleus sp. FACHB-61]
MLSLNSNLYRGVLAICPHITSLEVDDSKGKTAEIRAKYNTIRLAAKLREMGINPDEV